MMSSHLTDLGVRDAILEERKDISPAQVAALKVAAMFSLAHQMGRIATVLEGISPLIELAMEEARKDARG